MRLRQHDPIGESILSGYFKSMAQKVIIDTDIGDDIDDAIAISFAVRRPELDVLAITTCYGPTRKRCRMLAKQLALLGRDDIPVAAGPETLLSYANDKHEEHLANWTPMEYDFVGDEEEVRAPDPRGAVELIYDTICRHEGEVTLVPIGPLTNIATLFREHPDAAQKLKCLLTSQKPHPRSSEILRPRSCTANGSSV